MPRKKVLPSRRCRKADKDKSFVGESESITGADRVKTKMGEEKKGLCRSLNWLSRSSNVETLTYLCLLL